MKRSQRINLNKMRKLPEISSGQLAKVSIVVGGSTVLVGCGGADAFVYRTISECELDHPSKVQHCELSYRRALSEWNRTAPRFMSMKDCEYDFGYGECREQNRRFSPVLAGFMLAQREDSDDIYDLDFDRPKPLGKSKSRSAYNKWVGANGVIFGDATGHRMKVSRKQMRPLKGGARTLGRGGFGKIASSSSRGG